VDHRRQRLLQHRQPGRVQHGRDDRARRLAGHADVADRRAVLRGQPGLEHAAHAVPGQPRRVRQPGARPCGPPRPAPTLHTHAVQGQPGRVRQPGARPCGPPRPAPTYSAVSQVWNMLPTLLRGSLAAFASRARAPAGPPALLLRTPRSARSGTCCPRCSGAAWPRSPARRAPLRAPLPE